MFPQAMLFARTSYLDSKGFLNDILYSYVSSRRTADKLGICLILSGLYLWSFDYDFTNPILHALKGGIGVGELSSFELYRNHLSKKLLSFPLSLYVKLLSS